MTVASPRLSSAPTDDDLTVFVVAAEVDLSDALILALGYCGFGLRRFSSRSDFLAACRPDWRGCVLSNATLPDGSGLDFLPPLLSTPAPESATSVTSSARRVDDLPVILFADALDVGFVRRAFLAGAIDVLAAPIDFDELKLALDRAMARARAKSHETLSGQQASGLLNRLTPRELEVALLVRQGHDNRRIGERLTISHRTVEVHKTRVMQKLAIRSLADLIALPMTSRSRGKGSRNNAA